MARTKRRDDVIHVHELHVDKQLTLLGVEVSTLGVDGLLADADELNILNGALLSTAELNTLVGITSTPAELNILTGALLDVGELNKLNGLTSSTAELNKLTGVTATPAEINILAGMLADATLTAGAADSGTVTIQLKNAAGGDMAVRSSVFGYLSNDAGGDSIATAAPSGGVVIGTDGLAIPVVAGKAWMLTSEADGDIDLALTEGGAATWYFILVLPNGKLKASGAIVFNS